jgi:hypothetical protein
MCDCQFTIPLYSGYHNSLTIALFVVLFGKIAAHRPCTEATRKAMKHYDRSVTFLVHTGSSKVWSSSVRGRGYRIVPEAWLLRAHSVTRGSVSNAPHGPIS